MICGVCKEEKMRIHCKNLDTLVIASGTVWHKIYDLSSGLKKTTLIKFEIIS